MGMKGVKTEMPAVWSCKKAEAGFCFFSGNKKGQRIYHGGSKRGGIKMGKVINKTMGMLLALIFVSILSMATTAEALEPRLLWEKKFKYPIDSVDLATETGQVILSLDKREIILYDRNGNERFHWGPRIDRAAGGAQISKDGKYFVFYSGYTAKYADEKNLPYWADDRIHFYSTQTKKELWNVYSPEGLGSILPDGSSAIVYAGSSRGFEIFNSEGKKTSAYQQQIWGGVSFKFSPDSSYFAVVGGDMQPLMLFKKDGTKLWERGRHSGIASISEGASYISTYPYSLGLSYVADSQNTHLGTVYDKNGNKVLEGLGIVSENGTRVAMYAPDKITIISLPDKAVLKEIPIKVNLPDVSDPFFAVFSYDGRYLIVRSGTSLFAFDLVANIQKEIAISELGKFPEVLLTRDGKYLSVFLGRGTIYYYQLY